ncbi:hypothetical protein SEA_LOCA_23 [Microbacterium phage Loca]|uniref:Uncharacterized protein n=1 Tax=Microbacterium phage Quaker TaxID=2250352 RepID=A0A2Z5H7Q4_9CAUD|nr:hypothetical protein JTF58_gp23 [Microbacterium phage Quaker]QKY78789.1 hypothetical protein SEA_LIVINGWATER_23 [Microbacterium phage Livingwater]QYC54917.1 hypothetical protein SEA_LEAFY_23 [Microbacterium phage Leafy]URM86207.1 hypothetical protein SEA_LOCA_23 [Microbacterium phage Loca]UVK59395.1 hypothetical protein SEA_MRGREEN_23 [Microbacterium phage MrGreen]UYL85400.1 hypothetical protein SEA_MELBEE03_23 [Microbacterium phage MelBee03]
MTNPSAETTAAANRLSELTEHARAAATRARRARQTRLLNAARSLGAQLDAARTQLIVTGPQAVDAAEAFVAAGSVALGGIVAQLDRLDLGIDRIAAERVDAADVLAWIEWHGIHLYPYQRRAIEQLLPA